MYSIMFFAALLVLVLLIVIKRRNKKWVFNLTAILILFVIGGLMFISDVVRNFAP